ncbi:uncharacterized protein LOC133825336 [Humulus lupulus]|uniref:uncharacterized protein LOC133825336 n=1 Tax=Humulus lupulus TaxID=3486 RepID=UPI002B412320|nr:uncharacterized protein LOC133825336 [Humulus lupulus]
MEAEEWMSAIESIFRVMKIEDRAKISYASRMLKKNACFWWENLKLTFDVRTMSWAGFFKPSMSHFTMKPSKVDEFLNLVQGGTSFSQYAQQFNKLAKFAGNLVANEEAKVDNTEAITYAQALQRTLKVERMEDRIWKESVLRKEDHKSGQQNNGNKRKGPENQGNNNQLDKKPKGSFQNHLAQSG